MADNPLNTFVTKNSTGAVKLPDLPDLGALVQETNFKEGHVKYHQLMTEWKQQVEQILNERFAAKEPISGTISEGSP